MIGTFRRDKKTESTFPHFMHFTFKMGTGFPVIRDIIFTPIQQPYNINQNMAKNQQIQTLFVLSLLLLAKAGVVVQSDLMG